MASPLALLGLWLLRAPTGPTTDWPQWRGPAGDDVVAQDSGWRDGQWRLTGPIWQADVGLGATSPIVARGRLYVMGWNEGQDTLQCLDAATGKQQWQSSYPCPPYSRFAVADQGFYKGPSATPTYDLATDRLYTLSTDGDLICWDVRSQGTVRWRRSLHEICQTSQRPDVGGGIRDYGCTTSPLLHGDWVIVEAGGADGNLVAFDKQSGEVRWRSQCADPAGHTGGLTPLTVGNIPCVAVLTLRNVVAVRLDPGQVGKTLATFPWQTNYGNNIPTPASQGNCLVVTSGQNQSHTMRLEVTPQGIRPLWESPKQASVCSPVIYHGRVYLVRGEVQCLDYESGKALWSGGLFGDDSSCVVTCDSRLVVFGNRKLALVDTAGRSPDQYHELALRPDIGRAYSWPHVAVAGGRLYAKDSPGHLYCFQVGR